MTWMEKLQRVCKWRTVFASQQLGTRLITDSEFQAVKHTAELGIVLRVDVNALSALLIEKGVFTQEEFTEQIGKEADFLNDSFAKKFPGATAHSDGIHYDLENPELQEWLSKFPA